MEMTVVMIRIGHLGKGKNKQCFKKGEICKGKIDVDVFDANSAMNERYDGKVTWHTL